MDNTVIEEAHDNAEVQADWKDTKREPGKHSHKHSMALEEKWGEEDNAKIYNADDILAW